MDIEESKPSLNFIEQIIEEDLASGKHQSIQTRFPPEPNGYLHIGHAKSIVLNFELAKKYNGTCNLRFDDTNPEKEKEDYVTGIKNDISWLGYEWGETLYTSNYFDQLYVWAQQLIKEGKAYVDDQSAEDMSINRGTPSEPAKASPNRERTIEENLRIFEEMKNGLHPEGSKLLRAKLDLASPNMLMRDPGLYRIKKEPHHRTGTKWNIYPMYDFAHGQSDSIEHITHSICTLEFENHRPLYNWFIKELEIYPSRQIEFARLNLSYTITSKRKLLRLVEEGHVSGWDDPRMPTLVGMRRRGIPPAAIKYFATRVGVSKRDNVIDVALLEHSVREELNKTANRVMGVLDPIKVVIENYPESKVEMVQAVNNPEDESAGIREMPFSREIYIDRSDFMENPPSPKKFFRLGPDREVRLKYAYVIRCTGFEKDGEGNILLIKCEYFADTRSGQDTSGKKVKGTLSWVSAQEAVDAEIRIYDRLFLDANPAAAGDEYTNLLNPDSLQIIKKAKVEPSVKSLNIGNTVQFERQGYFTIDNDSTESSLIFNRTIGLRDNWAKSQNN